MNAIPLPLCRWRRQPTAPGHHVCISPRVRCNAHGIPDEQCLSCRYVDHPPPPRQRLACVHFGELVGARPLRILDRSDGAAVLSRVHRCAVLGECTPNTVHVELQCCVDCTHHVPDWYRPVAGDVRHLMYFLYPIGPLWEWNVHQLLQRINLFNGRRLVTVAWGPETAPPDQVGELFGDNLVELRFEPNDPIRRELVGHLPMIEALEAYRGDGDVTFYGHGKGSSSHAYGNGVKRWAAEMYSGLLDYWPAVRRELETHATVGVYRRILSPAPAAHVPWHYSGSFRWLRNKDLYSRSWRVIDPNWYGSETYPGHHFSLEESCCLYGEFAYGGVGLYLEATWASWATAAADEWKSQHAADRETPMLVTVILTAHAQPERVHEAIASVRAQTCDVWQLVVMYSDRIDAADLVNRYGDDARIRLEATGEERQGSTDRCGQGWAINEAWRRNLVRGDLVTCLSDDDILNPAAVAGMVAVARSRPMERAWYGIADHVRLHKSGAVERLEQLGDVGTGDKENPLRGSVDGLQVWCRHQAWQFWPEDAARAREADGWWMKLLEANGGVYFAPVMIGTHRHTPESTFTR